MNNLERLWYAGRVLLFTTAAIAAVGNVTQFGLYLFANHQLNGLLVEINYAYTLIGVIALIVSWFNWLHLAK